MWCVVCVQTSQVGSKIPNKWQQFASPVTKSPSAILPSGNSEVQKVIFALSNFENVSKTLPKIGFWCEVQFARCHFTETSSDGNFKNLFNDILPYHMIKYYQNPREIHLSRLERNPDEKSARDLLRFQLLCWTDVRSRPLTKREKMPSPREQVTHQSIKRSWNISSCFSHQLVIGGTALIAAAVGGYFYSKRWVDVFLTV